MRARNCFGTVSFKLNFTEDPIVKETAKRFFLEEVAKLDILLCHQDINAAKEEDDLFGLLQEDVVPTQVEYLAAPASKSLTVLDHHPAVKSLFKTYNSILPSSAPLERLFSLGGLIFVPKRSSLSDRNFENLLLVKYNWKFY